MSIAFFNVSFYHPWVSLVAQMVKNLPAMQETQVWSLDWEDPLEKEMATRCSILAWEIPWTEEPGRLQSMGSQRVGHNWVINTSFFLYYPYNAHRICNDIPCIVSDINNLCPFSFLLSYPGWLNHFNYLFKELAFGFTDFILISYF